MQEDIGGPELTTHHDGHGLTETITVMAVDGIGPGGAHHLYRFFTDKPTLEAECVGFIQFQKGPRHDPNSTPGVVEGAVLAVLIDRLQAFQAGPYACDENVEVLLGLQNALYWIKQRAHNRADRGVLGKNAV